MQILRQSTEIKVKIGPVVSISDGLTPVTALNPSTADEAELLKHDAAATADISGATLAAITGADGYYNLTLTTSHTDTCGTLTVLFNDDSLCLPVKAEYMVVEEAIYDAYYAASATGLMPANLTQILGTALTETAGQTAAAFKKFFDVSAPTGTVNSLPTAPPDTAGGLPISDAGGLDLDTLLAVLSLSGTGSTLLNMVRLLARSDAAIATDLSSLLTAINADLTSGGGDYDNATESQEALRDWIGDGTNLTEAGGDGDHLTAAGGDGTQLTEAGGDGDHLTAAGGDGSQLTEAGGDGDHLTEAGGDGDHLTAAGGDIYHAVISFTDDDGNAQDEYTVTWFKNAAPVTSGITNPTVTAVKADDGSAMVTAQAMTQVGTTGVYKYAEGTNRIAAGESLIITVTADIDAGTRTFRIVTGRDD